MKSTIEASFFSLCFDFLSLTSEPERLNNNSLKTIVSANKIKTGKPKSAYDAMAIGGTGFFNVFETFSIV